MPIIHNAVANALENTVSRILPLRGSFSIEILYKPCVLENITYAIFYYYQKILHFMANIDVFKDTVIDEDEHKKTLQDRTSTRKGNLVPNDVVSMEKLYELQNYFQGPVNAKTQNSTL